jgi:hypothetical protein
LGYQAGYIWNSPIRTEKKKEVLAQENENEIEEPTKAPLIPQLESNTIPPEKEKEDAPSNEVETST